MSPDDQGLRPPSSRPPGRGTRTTGRLCRSASKPLNARVTIPGSKSITNRVLILAALAEGRSRIDNLLLAEDTRLMAAALGELGVSITLDEHEGTAEVAGCGGVLGARAAALHCGNSGTTLRFCAAVAALGKAAIRLDGIARMRQRPIGTLAGALAGLGARIDYPGEPGFPPMEVSGGGLRGGRVAMRSPESSQMVSALLMVAPYADGQVVVDVVGALPSRPYVITTKKLMERFGADVIVESVPSAERLVIPAPRHYRGTAIAVEPDASNASYFLAAPAVAGGRVSVEGLGTDSIQGDARFVDVLEAMGCRVRREPSRLTVEGPPSGSRLRAVEVDLNEMPDMVQTLAVVALFAEGTTVIGNVGNLRIKETDRLAALTRELGRLGATVEEEPSGIAITPPERIDPATVETYHDHRMAMSFALAGLRCPGLAIADAGCCAKTFPDFFDRFDGMLES